MFVVYLEFFSLGHVQVHKNGPGVPGAVLVSVLVCPKKSAQKRPLNTYGFFLGPLNGLSGAQSSPQKQRQSTRMALYGLW